MARVPRRSTIRSNHSPRELCVARIVAQSCYSEWTGLPEVSLFLLERTKEPQSESLDTLATHSTIAAPRRDATVHTSTVPSRCVSRKKIGGNSLCCSRSIVRIQLGECLEHVSQGKTTNGLNDKEILWIARIWDNLYNGPRCQETGRPDGRFRRTQTYFGIFCIVGVIVAHFPMCNKVKHVRGGRRRILDELLPLLLLLLFTETGLINRKCEALTRYKQCQSHKRQLAK
jgi:hypothetical protein